MQRWIAPVIPRYERDGWTPLRGFVKGALVTLCVAVLLAVAMCVLAWYLPSVIIDDLLVGHRNAIAWDRILPWGFGINLAIGGGVIWLLMETMYRTSGMEGDLCTSYTLLLAFCVIASKHMLFAVHGVQLIDDFVIGWVWVSPEYLIWYSYGSWVGLLAAACWRYFNDQ